MSEECDHDMVKLLLKEHGDVWICTKCKKASKDVLTDEEKEVMVEFILTLRNRKNIPKNRRQQ